jgi:hypothetical protein
LESAHVIHRNDQRAQVNRLYKLPDSLPNVVKIGFRGKKPPLVGRSFKVQNDINCRAFEGLSRLIAFDIVVCVDSGSNQARERVPNLQSHNVTKKPEVGHARQTVILDFDEPADRSRADRQDIDPTRPRNTLCPTRAAPTNAATILAQYLSVTDARKLSSVETPFVELRDGPTIAKGEL